MSRPKPKWRQAFDKVERAVGVPLENAAASHRFMDVMSTGIRVRRAATAKVAGAVHGLTGAVLHAVNIPTRDDVRTLTRHLTEVASDLRAIEQGQRRANTTGRSRKPPAEHGGD